MRIKTVTVLGANGTMGTNVSAIFASFGNAKVEIKMLNDMRPAPLTKISWQTLQCSEALTDMAHRYMVTDCDEKTAMRINGVSESDAMATAMSLINGGWLGLKGRFCKSFNVTESEE